MSLKPLKVQVPLTELPTLVEKKSKQTYLSDTPEPMSLPIKVEKILKGSLDLISSPSPSVKIQTIGGKV